MLNSEHCKGLLLALYSKTAVLFSDLSFRGQGGREEARREGGKTGGSKERGREHGGRDGGREVGKEAGSREIGRSAVPIFLLPSIPTFPRALFSWDPCKIL